MDFYVRFVIKNIKIVSHYYKKNNLLCDNSSFAKLFNSLKPKIMKTQQKYLKMKNIHSFILYVILSLSLVITSCGDDDDESGSSCTLAGLTADQQSLVLNLLSGDCGAQAKTWNYVEVQSAGVKKTWDGFRLALSKSTVGDKAAIQYSATLPTSIQNDANFQRVWPSTGKITIGAVSENSVVITRHGTDDAEDASVASATISLNEDKTRLTISFTVSEPAAQPATRALGTPNGAWTFVLAPAE